MSEHAFFITISLPLLTILAVFGMRYLAAVKEAKLRFASDEAYRQLAEKSATAQAETAQALASISATLSEVRTRVTVIEKVLKEVD